MAETARVIEAESDTIPAPAVDVSGGITVEALQALEEPVGQATLLMIEGDDSVFYSEDEEIPQEVFDFAPQSVSVDSPGPAEPPPSPQIQSSGAEELVPSLSHSIVLMEAGSMYHGGAMLEQEESLMENEINYLSSFVPVQRAEDEALTPSKTCAVLNEELSNSSKAQCAAPSPTQNIPQIDESLLADKTTESPSELHLEQESGTQERDTATADGSIATTERHEDSEEMDQSNESSDQSRREKYGTVSYRRIRRGIARQRIEEFEAMMQL
ncbi:hypothetical protein NFI96_027106 [Prochilodus magdalenae]|nr:hypothetical protein NFI96_027106 [Prochilodus magdalenae]